MKILKLFFVLVALTFQVLFSQTNTFYKSYFNTGRSINTVSPRVNVLQTNNGFVFYCYNESKFTFLDQNGYIQ